MNPYSRKLDPASPSNTRAYHKRLAARIKLYDQLLAERQAEMNAKIIEALIQDDPLLAAALRAETMAILLEAESATA